MVSISRRILLDRYAQKTFDKDSIEIGQEVIYVDNKETGMRNIGEVKSFTKDKVCLEIENNQIIWENKSEIDIPIETTEEEIWTRISKGISKYEVNKEKYEKEFYSILKDWNFIPGGRILTKAGTDQKLSNFNCFVIPAPHDSRQGIIKTLGRMIEIMSRGGGVGFNISSLRPRFSKVVGVNGRSSGSVSWADLYSFVTNLVEQAGCFAGSTKISTDKGLIEIEELVCRIEEGEKFKAFTHEGFRDITDSFRNGFQNVYRLQTDYGYSIDVTDNHPFIVFEGGEFKEKLLRDIEEGDNVLILRSKWSDDIEYVKLKTGKINSSHQNRNIQLPKELNEELAFLIGYYMANGYSLSRNSSSKYIGFAVPDKRPEDLKRIVSCFTNCFGVSPIIREGDGNCKIVSIGSILIHIFMKKNGFLKKGSINAFVPDAIFKSKKSVVQAFIGGYFAADGCNRGKKGGLGIDSISINLIKGIQILLAGLGIPSHYSVTERKEENWNTIYRLMVTGRKFSNKFADFLKDYTTKVYDNELSVRDGSYFYDHNFYDYFREEISLVGGPLASNTNRISWKAIDFIYGKKKELSKEKLDKLRKIFFCFTAKVSSIEYIGKEETYDITVDKTHLMSANGFYTHNSRRGALILLLDISHPDIFEFIDVKKNPNKINFANISVSISDDFMRAVEHDLYWNLEFPNTEFEKYDSEWDGNLKLWKEKGYPVEIYKTVKAKDLWNKICESAWACAEPGLFFVDRINYFSNSHYYGYIRSCNPCGEQAIPDNAVCNLGAINLSKFVNSETKEFMYHRLDRTVRIATRFLDNVIDDSYYFEEHHENQQKSERRLGLGIMGLADALIRMEIKYGSDESLTVIENIFKVMRDSAYDESCNLAVEKGAFPAFDLCKYRNSGFYKTLPKTIQDKINKTGIRNVTLLTVAPTGSTGTMAETSTGIEPFFEFEFVRNSRIGKVKIREKVYQEWLDAQDVNEESLGTPEYFITSSGLTPEEHVKVMATAQKYVDSSISKTVNCPEGYTVEQVKQVYELMYKLGCKGGTIYRDNSRREQVLEKTEDKKTNLNSSKDSVSAINEKPVLDYPSVRDGKTYSIDTPVGRAHITINEFEKNPIECFVEVGKAGSDLQSFSEALGRLISLVFRLRSDVAGIERVNRIVNQLEGIGGARSIGFGEKRVLSLPDAVAKILKAHYEGKEIVELKEKQSVGDLCPSCGNTTFIRAEGCHTCKSCGYSEC